MRIRILDVIFTLLLLVLVSRIWFLQVNQYEKYENLSKKNRIRLVPIKGARGCIRDRFGEYLAWNKLHFQVLCIPEEIKYKDQIFRKVSEILNCSVEELYKNYRKNFKASFAPTVLYQEITKRQAMVLEEYKLSIPGILVYAIPKREYRYGLEFAHILGYLSEVNENQLSRLKEYGYKMKDFIGVNGIEKQFDKELKGEDGGMQVEVDNFGRLVKIIGYKNPVKGKDIFLTLDMKIQRIAENVLGEHTGSILFMDADTGEILTMVSHPSFDPNAFIPPRNNHKIIQYLKHKKNPFINRTISGLYPPGSIFKIVTAVAALEKKKISPHKTFFCAGKTMLGRRSFPCWFHEGHREVDVSHALKFSCNIFFYHTGKLIGVDSLAAYALSFGYGRKTGIELPGEKEGLLPQSSWKLKRKGAKWWDGDTYNFAIGQGFLLTTPIQNLLMVAAVINGGYSVSPYIVKKIGEQEVGSYAHKVSLGVEEKTIQEVRKGLRMVVNDADGTGRFSRPSLIRIEGKTGTAQVSRKKEAHGWFAGYTTNTERKIAFIVMLEHGGSGGLGPARMLKTIMDTCSEEGLIKLK